MRISIFILKLIVTSLCTSAIPAVEGDCYVKPNNCVASTVYPCYGWPDVTQYFHNCVKACNVLLFSSGAYYLNRTLLVSNHNSISIIGSGPQDTKIICLDSPASLFVAVNISMIRIINISWINCGGIFKDVTMPRSYTTLLLHNVMSVTISNVAFTNIQGYALFGINLFIKLSFINVSITDQQTYSNYTHICKGLMLLNAPTSGRANYNQLQNCSVLITNCKFYSMHMHGNGSKYTNTIYHDATAIALIIHQQTVVNISNTVFENITSDGIPVVLISYTLNKPTFIVVTNSVFTNISCIENSVVDVNIRPQFQGLPFLHKFYFQDCKFSHNRAARLLQISSPDIAVNNGFYFNNISDLSFEDTHVLMLTGRNIFDGNQAEILIYLSCSTSFYIQGSVTFLINRVKVLLYLTKYLTLNANSLLNITNNEVNRINDATKHQNFYLIYIVPHFLSPDICPIQTSGCTENVTLLNTSIIFQNNTGYQIPIYGYPFNSCRWDYYCNKSVDNLFESIIQNDQDNKNVSNSICYCESNLRNCSKTKIKGNIYPGQSIYLSLISTASNSPATLASYDEQGISVCENATQNICLPFPQLHVVYQTCTNLTFMVKSNSTDYCILCLKTITQSQNKVLRTFSITLRECPLGMVLYDGLCVCDPKLISAVTGLTCNSDGTLIRPPYTWISAIRVAHNITDIIYSNECYLDYCSYSSILDLDLNNPDAQCHGNRDGMLCGRCVKGFSAVFGTTGCKRCTNIWLLLIPVLAVAGIILVLVLFALNLTIVDGHVYGYILFVNILNLYSFRIFPSNYLIYLPIVMSNLDLGIEVCFYNGMTSYATMWLQFIFPLYVILLVFGLSYTSRYSRVIERLTHKRIIPVIATLYLLVYNKMMFVTSVGLFAYRKLHFLKLQKTEVFWSLDTEISLFRFKFNLLFAVCILIFFFLLLPTLILFLFPKQLMRCKLVAKYLKPFLDAYQASFKDNCRHFLGVELILCVILYGNYSLRADYTASLYTVAALLYLAYLIFQQPFKDTMNIIIYALYICNLSCVAILFTYYQIYQPKSYALIFNCLVGVGFVVFLGIVLLHIFRYCILPVTCSEIGKKLFSSRSSHNDQEIQPLNYAQYRDEVLLLDPNV